MIEGSKRTSDEYCTPFVMKMKFPLAHTARVETFNQCSRNFTLSIRWNCIFLGASLWERRFIG